MESIILLEIYKDVNFLKYAAYCLNRYFCMKITGIKIEALIENVSFHVALPFSIDITSARHSAIIA